MGHRWDIQLLRAVAVLSVFAYHAGIPGMPGGSLGVDVFFVISGYLITVTWLRQVSASRMDLAGFLRNRLARTMPAAAVAAVVITGVALVVAPDQWHEMWWHLAASLTATENVLMAVVTTGEFDGIASLTPYTHFWSMAMEVQFYLIWPGVLATVLTVAAVRAGFGRRHAWLMAALVVVIGMSFYAYAAWGVSSHAVAYFSPLTRAWQLATGALLALIVPTVRSSAAPSRGAQRAAVLAFVGGIVILIACFILGQFAHDTDSPLWGVAVVATTASLLVGGRWLPALPDRVATVLGSLLALGTISYGFYLWHLPVLWTVSELQWDRGVVWWVCVCATSLFLASLSWHVIEKPAIAWARRKSHVGRVQPLGSPPAEERQPVLLAG